MAILYCCAAIVAVLLISVVVQSILRKLRRFPPRPFPTLPLVGHRHLFRQPLHRSLADLSARDGPILLLQFLSRTVLLVSSPSAAEECFTKSNVIFANRPQLLAGKLLGNNWRNLRPIPALEIFAAPNLRTVFSILADEVWLMLQRLRLNPPIQAVNMKTVFYELMINVMTSIIAGKRYYDENTAEEEEAKRFRKMAGDMFGIGGASSVAPVLSWVAPKRSQAKRDGFMQELIEDHRRRMAAGNGGDSEADGRKTLVELLLSLQRLNPTCYTDEVIRGMMTVVLATETDTTAGIMEWGLSLLLNNPESLRKAQSEIDTFVGHDSLICESDVAGLPYLRCIINETMRMHPASPLLVPNDSCDDCTIGGYNIPRGTMLLVNMWAVQNDPRIWAEPEKFMPQRFEGPERAESGDGLKLMPFGSGRRCCPGEGLARRMVGLALGSLIQCFDWERASQEMVDMSEATGVTGLGLTRSRPLMAKCKPRAILANLLSPVPLSSAVLE
ncbi:cytochrome P450 81Q32-like [Diospyros lotus]|uniref:cytochrome P450 81Q32-like n=1 Tax=Diospyros lotus TaxID=55363 RepID=UPI0022567464|nr:cytochrome P450 81Q32-like [Diospyros lotus]XP_052203121.1 cytochrome P450 81Q32-like [Diospyros lotus]